ncbi:VCBS repeat-containing protein, partial [Saccharothrix sp. SC076]|nr:VCBS repeat-containing protein [Saccharothrix obliqua]
LSGRCDAPSGCARDWKIVGVGDFSGDNRNDLVLYNAFTGEVSVWKLNVGTVTGTSALDARCDTASACAHYWKIVGIGNLG